MVNELFAGSIRNIEAALDVRAVRQNMIAANIANADTPGYRALDIDFEQTMAGAIEAMDRPAGGEPLRPSEALRGALKVTGADAFSAGNANNTVGVEEQMGRLEENGLMYQITTQLASAKFQGLKRAIDEGGRNG